MTNLSPSTMAKDCNCADSHSGTSSVQELNISLFTKFKIIFKLSAKDTVFYFAAHLKIGSALSLIKMIGQWPSDLSPSTMAKDCSSADTHSGTSAAQELNISLLQHSKPFLLSVKNRTQQGRFLKKISVIKEIGVCNSAFCYTDIKNWKKPCK